MLVYGKNVLMDMDSKKIRKVYLSDHLHSGEIFTYLKENIQEGDAFLSVNELNAFILVTNFPENTFYFWDESDWNVEEAYKAFGKRMQGIENLDEIKEVTGRIWVLDSRNDHLLEKIQEQYDIKVIERKEYDTKYHGCQYTYTLIEKQ